MWDYRARRSDKPRTGKGDDGDTILMVIDLGMGTFAEEPIRLKGCFAPETGQPGGKEAARFLALALEEIEEGATARKARWPFLVVTEPNASPEPDERRSFVRYIGTLFAMDTGENINAAVIHFLAGHPEWGGGTGGDPAEDG